MNRSIRIPAALLAAMIVVAACGDDDATDATSTAPPATEAPATTQAATTTTATTTVATTEAPTTTSADAFTMTDGVVTIDWSQLDGIFFAPPVAGSTDPFFHVHNDPGRDGFFLSVEAYTTGYGTAWTGELGMFQIDCSPAGSGICVHFDPDGAGPIGDLGADFLVTGDIEVLQADGDGFEVVLSTVTFTDGTTIPGPTTVAG